MDVPENIKANGVHTERFAHLDALIPIGTWNARIVKFGSFDHKGLAIQQKSVFSDGEIATASQCCKCGKTEQQCCNNRFKIKLSVHVYGVMNVVMDCGSRVLFFCQSFSE